MSLNKKLKAKPKILVSADKPLTDDLMARDLIHQSLPFPLEAAALIQAIDNLQP